MSRGRRQRFIRQFVLFAILLLLIGYVMHDAIHGSHGLIARQRIEQRISTLKSELEGMKSQRVRLERDAELLGAKATQHPELLDEQARSLLDLANPADIVIVNDPPAAK